MNPICELCEKDVPTGYDAYVVETEFGVTLRWLCPECVRDLYEPVPQ